MRLLVRLGVALRPPRDLLGLIRWAAWLATLVLAARLLADLLPIDPASPAWPLQLAESLALIWLCWRWVQGYHREGFSLAGTLSEGAALLGLGLTLSDPLDALSLVYIALAFRALYGSAPRALLGALVYLAAQLGASALSAGLPTDIEGLYTALLAVNQPLVLQQVPGLLIVTLLMQVLAASLMRNKRILASEVTLAAARPGLIAAPDQQSIFATALDIGLALLANGLSGRTHVAAGDPSGMRYAVVGAQPGDAPVDLRRFVAPIRARLLDGQAVRLDQGDAVEKALATLLRSPLHHAFVVPFVVQCELVGVLIVAGEASLASEHRHVLERLGVEVTQVLETVVRAEELHRRQGEARFRALGQHASDIIRIVDPDSTIRYQSPSLERVLGYGPAEHISTRLLALIHPEDRPLVSVFLTAAAQRPGISEPVQYRVRHLNGTWVHVETIVSNLIDDPNVGGLLLTTRDISERKGLEDQLAHQAFHDPLTNLPNRVLFRDRVAQALVRAKFPDEGIALLFVDLDDFKTVNDSLGHAAGDELLVTVADRLHSCVSVGDTIARFGGDEFALLLSYISDGTAAERAAARINEAFKVPFIIQGREVFVGSSIGIALGTRVEQGADELLRAADVAMYIAKREGKGRYEIFQPSMHTAAVERLEIEAGLRRAIERREFTLHYQPTVKLDTGRMVGVEALVRWQHPERGLIAPADFVPFAEETGLIVPIGRWVLEQACKQARLWHEQYPLNEPLTMSVNLSVRQFQEPGLVETVADILRVWRLPPETLILEITESVMMRDSEASTMILRALKRLGVQLAIDDFGTGFSSLGYLQRFPLDVLKIDKSFVDNVTDGPDRSALAGLIVQLARTFKLRAVAEGIENIQQVHELRALGCELGQGFHYGRPMEAFAIERLLNGIPAQEVPSVWPDRHASTSARAA
jgi:diguanylate cyclase (GGDEF)-like protein/PAS domain S-box-containing protein